MKEARIFVDFTQMLEEDLVCLSETDQVLDSAGNKILLSEGLAVKLYADDLGSCGQKDNLIADGIVEANKHFLADPDIKWNCRINSRGIYNESQKME